MELVLAVAALAALGLLALRFGVDSRPGYETPESQLASSGVVWDKASTSASAAVEPMILISRVPEASDSFPTLRVIDVARAGGIPPLAADPNATTLEIRARQLTDEFWSEHAWLTGRVPHGRFERVVASLEKERGMPAGNVTLLVMRETAAANTALAM
jgi:hypothetical protein